MGLLVFLGVNALHSYDDAIAKINTEESIFTDEEEDVIATIINLEADDRELGNYGRIFIPSQNYSAKLNNATYDIPSDNTKLFQEWVDADDCTEDWILFWSKNLEAEKEMSKKYTRKTNIVDKN